MPDLVALLAGFAAAVAAGRPAIALLRRWGCGQQVRDDGPRSHLSKAGTPTMGGIIIIAAFIIATAVGAWRLGVTALARDAQAALLVIWLALAFALVGVLDDRAIIKHQRSLGLRARHKLALQFLIAAGFLYLLWALHIVNPVVVVPFSGHLLLLGWWYYPAAAVWIVFTSNSVNLTDGLDGLAAGLCAIAALAVGALATAQAWPAVGVMCFALAGACVGFLWYNAHPARVFMGDTGALALGAALAGAAIVLKAELFLLIVGVIFCAEALSVMLQVAHFRLTGRRVLRMSPLHHHLELSGWPEPLIVARMWIAGALIGWGAVMAERILA